MKTRTSVVLSMVGVLGVSSAGLAAESDVQASPEQQAGMPGVGAEAVETVTATVKAVDLDKREVTLVTPDGKEQTVTVGPEARNLPQVKVGDQVVVKFYQAIALQLKKATSAVRERTERVYAGRTPLGAKPGGFVGRTVDAVGTVEAIDPAKRTVTLRGAKYEVTLKAGKDVDLSAIKVGDNVEASYVEALALSVQPKP
jgi:Cu/Ag efflux protein CusF